MERAILVAEQAPIETPTVPRVGALLVRDGELLGSAYRGEVGQNSHAEVGLLDGKLANLTDLTDCTLFTTLEPCTIPHHGVRPCAERIVERGVARVVIGLIDPHPFIGGRGYWHLLGNGVEVELFAPDLARAIALLIAPYVEKHRTPMTLHQEMVARLRLHKEALFARQPALQSARARLHSFLRWRG